MGNCNGFVKTGSVTLRRFGGFKAYTRYQVDLTFLMTTFIECKHTHTYF